MKIMLLIAKNIFKLFRRKRGLCFTIILGITITLFGMLYYGGILMGKFYDAMYERGVTILIEVDKDKNGSELINDINQLVHSDVVKLIVMEDELDRHSGKKINKKNNKTYEFVGEYIRDGEVMAGKYFSERDTSPELILTEEMLIELGMKKIINFNIEVGNVDYKVIGMRGVADYENTYVVPLDYYINNFKVGYLSFTFEKYLTNKEWEKLENYLRNVKKINHYQMPIRLNPLSSKEFRAQLFQLILIFSVSLINIFMMLYFWLKNNIRSYVIYRVCGASNVKTAGVIIGSSMLIVLASDLLGLFIYYVLYDLIYSNISSKIGVADYTLIILIHILLCFSFTLIVTYFVLRKKEIYRLAGE